MKFKFGDKILVKGYLFRTYLYDSHQNRFYVWKRYAHTYPIEGIFLKRITLANGTLKTHGNDEEGYSRDFVASETIPGAWICRKGFKPEKVFLEDIEEIKP